MKDLFSKSRRSNCRLLNLILARPKELIVPEPQELLPVLSSQLDQTLAEKIYIPSTLGAIRQGEILTNLIQVRINLESLSTPENKIDIIEHPYAIVVTQDCDLVQDFNKQGKRDFSSNKIIPSILFCYVITAAELQGWADPGSAIWKRIKQNKDERYQFLEKIPAEDDAVGEGLPELGIDFKRFFTIPTDEVYFRLQSNETKRRCILKSPFLEHLSSRLYYYQGRIALPAEHRSE